MSDIIEKLRALAFVRPREKCIAEAADEIERLREELAAVTERMSKLDFERTAAELERDALREENARLREALKPLIEIKDYPDAVLMQRIRAAAAALKEAKNG